MSKNKNDQSRAAMLPPVDDYTMSRHGGRKPFWRKVSDVFHGKTYWGVVRKSLEKQILFQEARAAQMNAEATKITAEAKEMAVRSAAQLSVLVDDAFPDSSQVEVKRLKLGAILSAYPDMGIEVERVNEMLANWRQVEKRVLKVHDILKNDGVSDRARKLQIDTLRSVDASIAHHLKNINMSLARLTETLDPATVLQQTSTGQPPSPLHEPTALPKRDEEVDGDPELAGDGVE